MSWYLAPSLVQLREEINARWPGRDLASDGSIGDAAHSSRSSDHNPDPDSNPPGRVDAIDVDENPARGSTAEDVGDGLWDLMVRVRPAQLKYAIYERQIVSSYPKGRYLPYQPRPYSGTNPHEGHIHISVLDEWADTRHPWGVNKELIVTPLFYARRGTPDFTSACAAITAAGVGSVTCDLEQARNALISGADVVAVGGPATRDLPDASAVRGADGIKTLRALADFLT